MSAILDVDDVVAPTGREVLASVDARTLELVHGRRSRDILRRGWLVRRALLLAGVLGLTAAFFLAAALFGADRSGDHVSNVEEVLLFLAALPVLVVLAKIYGLYDRDEERTDHSTLDDVTGVFHLVTVGAWIVFAGSRLLDFGDPGLAKIGAFWAIAIGAISFARVAARAYCRRHVSYLQN